MNFYYKAAVYNLLSLMPFRGRIQYSMQKYLSKSLPVNKDFFLNRIGIAQRHINALTEYIPNDNIENSVFYEFGTGWTLNIALAYWAMGVEEQIVTDVQNNVKIKEVNHIIDLFHQHRNEVYQVFGENSRIPEKKIAGSRDLVDHYGITNRAPCPAYKTSLKSDCFDFVSNTATLQHIPRRELGLVINECYRLLKPGGIQSNIIGMGDNYSSFDHSITPYNYFKYSKFQWRLINSPMLYQNRLVYNEFVEIFKSAGFKILEAKISEPSQDDIQTVKKLKIHRDFDAYSYHELAVRGIHIIAQKNR